MSARRTTGTGARGTGAGKVRRRAAPAAGDDRARDRYQSPLLTRYASPEMSAIFSERSTVLLWRRIWLALAESQRELGLPIGEAQIAALRAQPRRRSTSPARPSSRASCATT